MNWGFDFDSKIRAGDASVFLIFRRTDWNPNPSSDSSKKTSKNSLSQTLSELSLKVERKGVEPSTSALRTHDSAVLSDNQSELAATPDSRCTNGCTSEPENHHEAELGTTSQSIEPKRPGDFSAALAMIATLPLSDAEKAEAVRRLMGIY